MSKPALKFLLRSRRWALLLAAVVSIASSTGCLEGSNASLKAMSHYTFPNSNVIPLGNAVGEASRVRFLFPGSPDGDLKGDAIDRAIKSKGGDLLIDYVEESTTTSLGLFHVTTVRVSGTVAKMDVGRQRLDASEEEGSL